MFTRHVYIVYIEDLNDVCIHYVNLTTQTLRLLFPYTIDLAHNANK